MKSHQLGIQGELYAQEFLRKQNYKIIETNYRCSFGEIDIIAQEGESLCFIEVKTRQEDGWDAFEAVHPLKQKKMIKVALMYLMSKFGTDEIESRFDVLALWPEKDTFKAELLKNAFQLS